MRSSIKKPAAAFFAVAAAAAVMSTAPASAEVDDDGDRTDRIASTNMRGRFEIPGPGDDNGRGQFAAVITTRSLCYSMTAKKIEPATAAHIHIGGPDVAGPITVGLVLPTRQGVSDCIDPVPDDEDTEMTLSESELDAIRFGPAGFYINVHNKPFPAGAIRGQLG